MEERRSNPRRHVALAATIVVNKRRSPVECTVRDLSDSGAKIEILEDTAVPYEFELQIPEIHLCVLSRVAWTNGRNYGLMFIEEPRITDDTDLPPPSIGTNPTPEPDARSVILNLSETQYERLRRFAFERRLSHQEILERALRAYLNQQEANL
jgi:hypothetical protein